MNFAVFRRLLFAACLTLFIGCAMYVAWPLSDDVLRRDEIRSMRIVDRTGRLLREVRPQGRGIPVTLNKVPSHAIKALIATEDRYFYRHFGVNPLAIARATLANAASGEIVSGASTITMQVARMLRASPSRHLGNKILEALLALRLEAHLSKEDILTLWLNRAYFGNQAYGIESAADVYFGKKAIDLTLAEAAFLIGLPQNPVGYDPYRFLDHAQLRWQRVLQALHDQALITDAEMRRIQALPLPLRPREQTFAAPQFVEYTLRQFGDETARPAVLQTTLDLQLQEDIESLTRTHLRRLDSEYVTNAAAIVIDNTTGDILAYMGSADFWSDRHGGQNDGVQMLRQPGSALKPFTYALALNTGRYTPATILADIELQIPEAGGAFAPQNYDKTYHGPVPLREALACSYNIPAIRVARELTAPALLSGLHEAGFASLNRNPEHYGVGLTLGNGEVRLFELAYAYGAFARQGYSLSPRSVHAMIAVDGDSTFVPVSSSGRRFLSPEIAYLITDILKDPEAREPAFGRYGPLELPFPTAVKTGTSKDYRDNWAAGFTPRHTVAVWVGNFDGTPMQRVSGVSGAGPLFKSIMLRLGEGGDFARPEALETHEICPLSGLKPSGDCPHRKLELFLPGKAPSETCSVHRRIEIDTESMRLADASTPAHRRESRLYTVHPELFHNWMRDQNLPFPPASMDETKPDAEPEWLLQITYPVAGMLFQIDPVLRRPFQQIRLQEIHDERLKDIEWLVDGQPFPGASWKLQPGEFVFELQARTAEGAYVKSPPVSITVIDDRPAANTSSFSTEP